MLNRLTQLLRPKSHLEAIFAQVRDECEAAKQREPQSSQHHWLSRAWLARVAHRGALHPLDHTAQQAAYQATLVAASYEWPHCMTILAVTLFAEENPSGVSSVGKVPGLLASVAQTTDRLRSNPDAALRLYERLNPEMIFDPLNQEHPFRQRPAAVKEIDVPEASATEAKPTAPRGPMLRYVLRCPECERSLQAEWDDNGTYLECPHCREAFDTDDVVTKRIFKP